MSEARSGIPLGSCADVLQVQRRDAKDRKAISALPPINLSAQRTDPLRLFADAKESELLAEFDSYKWAWTVWLQQSGKWVTVSSA